MDRAHVSQITLTDSERGRLRELHVGEAKSARYEVNRKVVEPVGDGVSEMRVLVGPGYSVFFGRVGIVAYRVPRAEC